MVFVCKYSSVAQTTGVVDRIPTSTMEALRPVVQISMIVMLWGEMEEKENCVLRVLSPHIGMGRGLSEI